MTTADEYWDLTTYAISGDLVRRFIDFHAVIPMAEAQQPGHRGVVTLRIEAYDVAASDEDDYDVTYLFEADLPGVGPDSCDSDLFAAARKVLISEGFRLVPEGWRTDDERNHHSAPIAPLDASRWLA